jgi:hypothetical protein
MWNPLSCEGLWTAYTPGASEAVRVALVGHVECYGPAVMNRSRLLSVGRIVLLAFAPAQGLACGAATAGGSSLDAGDNTGLTGNTDAEADAPEASFCANGCIQKDGTCYTGGSDSAHCGGGYSPGSQCLDCGSRDCLFYAGVDGPTCVSSSSGAGSGSGGPTPVVDSGDDAMLVEAASGDSAGGGTG